MERALITKCLIVFRNNGKKEGQLGNNGKKGEDQALIREHEEKIVRANLTESFIITPSLSLLSLSIYI